MSTVTVGENTRCGGCQMSGAPCWWYSNRSSGSGLAEHADNDFPKLVILQSGQSSALRSSRSTTQLPGNMVSHFALLSSFRLSEGGSGLTSERRLVRAGDHKQDNDEGASLGRVDRVGECESFRRWGIWGRLRSLGRFVSSMYCICRDSRVSNHCTFPSGFPTTRSSV
jgi:hypothetical protein